MNRLALIIAAAILSGTPTLAEHNMPVNADGLKWGPAPPVLPKGAQIAVVSGDPFKDGPYVVRLKVPNGYQVPAHSHPKDEYLTVLSGKFNLGMGDKLDPKEAWALWVGGFVEAPC